MKKRLCILLVCLLILPLHALTEQVELLSEFPEGIYEQAEEMLSVFLGLTLPEDVQVGYDLESTMGTILYEDEQGITQMAAVDLDRESRIYLIIYVPSPHPTDLATQLTTAEKENRIWDLYTDLILSDLYRQSIGEDSSWQVIHCGEQAHLYDEQQDNERYWFLSFIADGNDDCIWDETIVTLTWEPGMDAIRQVTFKYLD